MNVIIYKVFRPILYIFLGARLCAMLFCLHPVHVEAVASLVGRADSLCALLFFLSLTFYSWGIGRSEKTNLSHPSPFEKQHESQEKKVNVSNSKQIHKSRKGHFWPWICLGTMSRRKNQYINNFEVLPLVLFVT